MTKKRIIEDLKKDVDEFIFTTIIMGGYIKGRTDAIIGFKAEILKIIDKTPHCCNCAKDSDGCWYTELRKRIENHE